MDHPGSRCEVTSEGGTGGDRQLQTERGATRPGGPHGAHRPVPEYRVLRRVGLGKRGPGAVEQMIAPAPIELDRLVLGRTREAGHVRRVGHEWSRSVTLAVSIFDDP